MNRWSKAFTLIELLTVMAIMVIIATIVMMGYFGTTRGMASKSAAQHISQSLNLARQSAIMQGRKVCVVFGQNRSNSWYSIVLKEGHMYTHDMKKKKDEFSDWSTLAGTTSIVYNLLNGETGTLCNITNASDTWFGTLYESSDFNFHDGIPYGFELYPRTMLPKGLQFGSDAGAPEDHVPEAIMFSAEGFPLTLDGLPQTAPYTLQIVEKIHASAGDKCVEITVNGSTGFVEVKMNAPVS